MWKQAPPPQKKGVGQQHLIVNNLFYLFSPLPVENGKHAGSLKGEVSQQRFIALNYDISVPAADWLAVDLFPQNEG